AFTEVAKKDDSPVLMGNTQQVYAGLTYGKGSLTESFSNQGSNRGFRV
ncbi:flagellar protein FliS, partial [Lachnotalea glycerini]